MLAQCWVRGAYLDQHPTAMGRLGWVAEQVRGWVALGMGMQCFATCTLLPTLHLGIIMLL